MQNDWYIRLDVHQGGAEVGARFVAQLSTDVLNGSTGADSGGDGAGGGVGVRLRLLAVASLTQETRYSLWDHCRPPNTTRPYCFCRDAAPRPHVD